MNDKLLSVLVFIDYWNTVNFFPFSPDVSSPLLGSVMVLEDQGLIEKTTIGYELTQKGSGTLQEMSGGRYDSE